LGALFTRHAAKTWGLAFCLPGLAGVDQGQKARPRIFPMPTLKALRINYLA
jgi:hypothetical protein